MLSCRIKRFLTLAMICLGSLAPCFSADPSRKSLLVEIRAMERMDGFTVKDTAYINRLVDLDGAIRYYNSDSLYTLASQSIEYSKKARYSRGECNGYLRMGDYFSDRGANDKALDYYRMGLEMSREHSLDELRLKILSNMAGEFGYKGEYASALNHYLEALELAEADVNLLMQSIINENIANLYGDQARHCS